VKEKARVSVSSRDRPCRVEANHAGRKGALKVPATAPSELMLKAKVPWNMPVPAPEHRS
jgi:hypothetical protein